MPHCGRSPGCGGLGGGPPGPRAAGARAAASHRRAINRRRLDLLPEAPVASRQHQLVDGHLLGFAPHLQLETIGEQVLHHQLHRTGLAGPRGREIALGLGRHVEPVRVQPARSAFDLEWLHVVGEANQLTRRHVLRGEAAARLEPEADEPFARLVGLDRRNFEDRGRRRRRRRVLRIEAGRCDHQPETDGQRPEYVDESPGPLHDGPFSQRLPAVSLIRHHNHAVGLIGSAISRTATSGPACRCQPAHRASATRESRW